MLIQFTMKIPYRLQATNIQYRLQGGGGGGGGYNTNIPYGVQGGTAQRYLIEYRGVQHKESL